MTDFVYVSELMKRVDDSITKFADADAPVLVTGESGTGKEVVARLLHERSARRDAPFVPVNCSGITENLFESEVFGHVKGAFTGADKDKKGLVEATARGTFFLDEVGELPPSLQPKLLRFVQERAFLPVGAVELRPFDGRLVAATNAPLDRLVREGRFRLDLRQRLHVLSIHLPPLRDRPEDLQPLAYGFLQARQGKGRRGPTRLTEEAMTRLRAHKWPGNVRELHNTLERAAVHARDGAVIDVEHLQFVDEVDMQGANQPAADVLGLLDLVLRDASSYDLGAYLGHQGRVSREKTVRSFLRLLGEASPEITAEFRRRLTAGDRAKLGAKLGQTPRSRRALDELFSSLGVLGPGPSTVSFEAVGAPPERPPGDLPPRSVQQLDALDALLPRLNAHFLDEANLGGRGYRPTPSHAHAFGFTAGPISLTLESTAPAADLRPAIDRAEAGLLAEGRESNLLAELSRDPQFEGQGLRLVGRRLYFTEILARREAFLASHAEPLPPVVSASGVLVVHGSRGTEGALLLHLRSAKSRTYPKRLHTLGGALEPSRDGSNFEECFLREVREELNDQSLSVWITDTLKLVACEPPTGFFQVVFFGAVHQRGPWRSDWWEGHPIAVPFTELPNVLLDDELVPTGKLHVMAWLAAGTPGATTPRFGPDGALDPSQVLELVLAERCTYDADMAIRTS